MTGARVRSIGGRALACLGALLLAGPAPAQDSTFAAPRPAASHWGEIPADVDSNRVPVADLPRPAWEVALLAPWRVVTFPIALVSRGVGVTLEALDEHHVIARANRLLGPRTGPFALLVTAQAGGNSGFGGGLVAEHTRFLGGDNILRARASTTTREDQRLGIAARFNRTEEAFTEVGIGYRHRPNVRYFGIGPATRPEDLAYFRQQTTWFGVADRRDVGERSHVEGRLEYSTAFTGSTDEDFAPPVEAVYPDALPAGFEDRSRGVTIGGQWIRESTPQGNRPLRGGLQRVLASYFEGVDDADVRFWMFRGEAQQFFTVGKPHRVLALRGVGGWIADVGADPVPAARLNTNDDPDLLRGYDDFRWRDKGLALVNAEYRWPMWRHKQVEGPGLDAFVLTDVGQVFGHARDLSLDHMTVSWGGGVRLVSTRGFVFRVEYARSEEDQVFRFRADQVFQFLKTGYIHGREPLPAR